MSFRSIGCYLLAAILFCTVISVMSAGSDVIVPYEWIVAGAYAKYEGDPYGPGLFYPNHTRVRFRGEVDDTFLEWTVLERVDDHVLLNVTFFIEGDAIVCYRECVPDEKVNIMDVATAAAAFGTKVYEWGFDPNADVVPDQKVNILDVATVAAAFGSYPGHPRWNSKADIAPQEDREVFRHAVHHRNLLLDIDVYSRDTFLDGKPLGKTCFWAEPYADIGDKVVLYGLPPEEIIGNVCRIDDEYMAGYGWPEVTVYMVDAFQIDPFCGLFADFDWHTGMAMTTVLQGSQPINPDGDYAYHDKNGTEHIIKRFASTPLATELNVGFILYMLWLESTNVEIGPPP